MPSNLAILKKELESEVGDALGLGMGPLGGDPEWSARDALRIRRRTKSGLRAFYFCGHVWSFMRLEEELTLAEGESILRLPDDFGGFAGDSRILVAQASDGLGQKWLNLTRDHCAVGIIQLPGGHSNFPTLCAAAAASCRA